MSRPFGGIRPSDLPALAAVLVLAATACTATALGGSTTPDQVEGIPDVVLQAYASAANAAPEIAPDCSGIKWSILAGIGQIESRHSTLNGSTVGANGQASPPILGPVLNGDGGFMAIPDTDGGLYDRDTEWDRAVGPMQFIPSTWEAWAQDGNGDGTTDPQNVFDAAHTTVAYLCGEGETDLEDPATLQERLRAYNNSQAYVDDVLANIATYDAIPVVAGAAAGGPVEQLGETAADCESLALHPDACHAHHILDEQFGVFYLSAGGRRGEGGSDHNTGQAIDYMITSGSAAPSPQVHQQTLVVVNWIIANHAELRVKGLIYDHHIWNAARDGVGPWEEVRRFHQDTGNNTQDHVDHIHLAAGPGPML